MNQAANENREANERPPLRIHEPAPPPPRPAKPYLAARDFAAYLGISYRTFKRWRAAGLLPRPIRARGWGRWSREEIVRWHRCGRPDQRTWDDLNHRKREPIHERINETNPETTPSGEPDQPTA